MFDDLQNPEANTAYIQLHLTSPNETPSERVGRNWGANCNPFPYFTSLTFFVFMSIFFSPPFMNRGNNKEGWFAPSIKHKLEEGQAGKIWKRIAIRTPIPSHPFGWGLIGGS